MKVGLEMALNLQDKFNKDIALDTQGMGTNAAGLSTKPFTISK
jgi:hypothetical protein